MKKFRKLALILAFALAFTQMPISGRTAVFAEPAEEGTGRAGAVEEAAERQAESVPEALSGRDEAKESLSSQEEAASSETVSGQEEAASGNSVRNAAGAETEEEAAGDQGPVEAVSWDGVQEAFNAGRNVELSGNISGEGKDQPLTVSADTIVTLDLNGYTIDRKAGDIENFNSVIMVEGGELTLKDTSVDKTGLITGGNASWGGGVQVTCFGDKRGKFTMIGGKISGNRATYGGGVSIFDSDFIMKGGEICENVAAADFYGGGEGGGVCVYGLYSDATMTMNGDATIQKNYAKIGGGIYCIADTNYKTLVNMSGGCIQHNEATEWGGGVYVFNSDFTMSSGSFIKDNRAGSDITKGYGGGIYVHGNDGDSSLSMNGGGIENNTATEDGGGVYIITEYGGNADFKLNGGYINGNTAQNDGGGIYSKTNGASCNTLTDMTGGSIEENTAKNGGGVYLRNSGFTMNAGSINKNIATEDGGGVAVRGNTGGAAFTMKGGEITKNTAGEHGGGAYVTAYTNGDTKGRADFKLIDGSIKNNKAGKGGGLYFSTSREDGTTGSVVESVLTMSGGSILGNEASVSGGGIFSRVTQHAWTILNLDDGTIENNKAKNGGGIYTSWNWSRIRGTDIRNNSASENGGGMFIDGGQCALSGGSIQGNTAGAHGGGMYVYYDAASIFELSGNFAIKDNKEGSPSVSGNVCLARNAYDPLIKITGKLENSDPVGVRLIDHKTGKPVGGVITQGLSGNGTLANFAGEGIELSLTADGEAQFVTPLKGIALPVSANVEVGKTATIPVTFTPENATNKNVTWTVSDANIASVANGVVTGLAEGSTVVTAKSEEGGFTASCTLTVTKAAPEPVPVDPTKKTYTVTFLNEGQPYDSQKVEDGKTANRPEKDPSRQGFKFLGWASGSTLWNFNTAIHSDLTLNAKYIADSPEAVSENTGSGLDPVPVINPSTKTIYLVKGQSYTAGGSGWTSDDRTIAKVAANTGKITAVKKGKTKISDGQQNTYNVIVAEPAFDANNKSAELYVGDAAVLKLTINSPDTESDSKYPVTFDSSNLKVATVADGTVTAVAKGSAKIYAYAGGKTYTAKVTVKDTYAAPKKQTERTASFNMIPLQSFSLKYDNKVFKISGATWSGNGIVPTTGKNGNPDGGYKNDIISITKAGKFTAIGKGTTTVSGTDLKNNKVTLTVTVKPVVTKESTYININKTETIKFPKVTNSKATWESSDKNVIKDYKNGKVKGNAVGKSTISCSYNGFDFSTLVYVEDPDFKTDDKLKLENKKYTMTLKKGEVYNRVQLNNVFQTIQYKTSKSSVAFIDENGVIYARGKGKANITVKINGKTLKLAVTVQE